jgi:hypothetical protein
MVSTSHRPGSERCLTPRLSVWEPLATWCFSLATIPVALGFSFNSACTLPNGQALWLVAAVCVLRLVGNARANLSSRYLELSTATALIPSAISGGSTGHGWQAQSFQRFKAPVAASSMLQRP